MAEPARLVETYRSAVAAWECDVMGHLTIALYFDRFADAAASLIERLAPGLPPGAAWRSNRLLVRYKRELRAGDGIAIRSGVIGEDGEAVVIGHELVATEEDEVATLVEHRLVPRALPYGGGGEVRRRLAAAAAPWVSPGFPPLADPAQAERMIPTGANRVKAAEVDERGELALSGYVHRFAYAGLHVCHAFGMTAGYMREQRRGLSTFETRLHLLAPPPGAGEGVELRSGLVGVGNSSLRMVHEMRGTQSGERLALFHQSAVHLDMEARRSTPLPPALREKAQALVLA
ncbi:MAG TPA: thioesterase family protein [Stellaceae bacterium]|nr:thioesterase family protein [Stellaceae bacterium]